MIHAFATYYDKMQLLKCRVRYNDGLWFKTKLQNLICIKVTNWEFPLKGHLITAPMQMYRLNTMQKKVRHLCHVSFLLSYKSNTSNTISEMVRYNREMKFL